MQMIAKNEVQPIRISTKTSQIVRIYGRYSYICSAIASKISPTFFMETTLFMSKEHCQTHFRLADIIAIPGADRFVRLRFGDTSFLLYGLFSPYKDDATSLFAQKHRGRTSNEYL